MPKWAFFRGAVLSTAELILAAAAMAAEAHRVASALRTCLLPNLALINQGGAHGAAAARYGWRPARGPEKGVRLQGNLRRVRLARP